MSPELFCDQHGPYDASLGGCPYCANTAGGRPAAPRPLDEDDLPTEFGVEGQPAPAASYGYDDETQPPRRGGLLYGDDEDETVLPARRRRGGRMLDDDIDVTVIDREETGLLGWMIVKSSPFMRRGLVMKVQAGSIWGRDPRKADMLIDDDKVSGLHARIQMKDDQFVLIDLGSANGTWVNDEEISAATPLKQDDEIKMGSTVFVLKTLG
jgi:hypothetical protein